MMAALRNLLFVALTLVNRCSALTSVWTEGYWGVALNGATSLFCEYKENSALDHGSDNVLHWFNSNTQTHKQYLLKDAGNILDDEEFDINLSWTFYTDGFRGGMDSRNTIIMKDAFMTLENMNLFILDHANLTMGSLNILGSYYSAVGALYPIARNTKTYFIDKMLAAGLSPDNMHLIGHSLGAHIIGDIGHLYRQENITINKCTGLDPAGPCFSTHGTDIKLSSEDCGFVETYHANAGQLGTDNEITDLEVYVNCAGKLQPYFESNTTCYAATVILQSALYTTGLSSTYSHTYITEIYAASVANRETPMTGIQCDGYRNFKADECANNEIITLFYDSDINRSYEGKYYTLSDDCDCDLD